METRMAIFKPAASQKEKMVKLKVTKWLFIVFHLFLNWLTKLLMLNDQQWPFLQKKVPLSRRLSEIICYKTNEKRRLLFLDVLEIRDFHRCHWGHFVNVTWYDTCNFDHFKPFQRKHAAHVEVNYRNIFSSEQIKSSFIFWALLFWQPDLLYCDQKSC